MVTNILKAISDDYSIILFKRVATGNYHTDASIGKLKLTRKQYYMRMSRLIKDDLIKRKNGMYILTSLGKIVFHCEKLIEIALKDYWKLKLIDVVKTDDKAEGRIVLKSHLHTKAIMFEHVKIAMQIQKRIIDGAWTTYGVIFIQSLLKI